MKRSVYFIISIFLLTFFSKNASAQYYFYDENYYDQAVLVEVGGSIGAMNCLTDLGGKSGIGKGFIKDLNNGKSFLSGGVYVNVSYKNAIGLRLELCNGKVAADDQVLSTVSSGDIARFRYNRNLNFQSSIKEYSGMLEIHPLLLFVDWESRDQEAPKYSPYLLGGYGSFKFNPQLKDGNRLIDLQPLSTEGQGFKEYPDRPVYKLTQTNYPFGLGLRYEISPIINLRGEFVYRLLTTDYLDDVSTNYIDPTLYALNGFSGTRLENALFLNNRETNGQKTAPGGKRGSPTNNDAYFSFNIKLGVNLRQRIR
jgi:hypothetical protein